jgi:AraC family transcriptional regulator, positive regulator of tynA and feaB
VNVQTAYDFDRWNDAMQAVCGRFVTQRANCPEHFVGNIQRYDLGGLTLADIRVNAGSIRRERGVATRGDDRFYFLVLQRQGNMVILNNNHSFTLQPNDMALLDSAQAFEMKPQGLINQLSIHLCRDAVDRLLPAGTCRFGKLEQASLSRRLLYGMFQQISKDHIALSEGKQHGEALQDALISLLQPCLHVEDAIKTGSPLRRLAEQMINEALMEPPTPDELAARLNVSVRHLYRQFEMNGESICRYINRQRLQCCARELTQTGNGRLPITTIAYNWGFADSAHFSRVFKRHYGMPPRDYRAQYQKIAD